MTARKRHIRRTGLICNGRHTGTENWEEIVWGRPPLLLGQIPKLIQLLLTEREEEPAVIKIVFGTGASSRDGVLEADCMLNLLFENIEKLPKFSQFAHLTAEDIRKLRLYLQSVIIADTETKNTAEEITAAITRFVGLGITRVGCVTCPTHSSRCTRDMLIAKEKFPANQFPDGFFLVPSDIHYVGASARDIIVIEPPHRGDTPPSFREFHTDTSRLTELFFRLPEEKRALFLSRIAEITDMPQFV